MVSRIIENNFHESVHSLHSRGKIKGLGLERKYLTLAHYLDVYSMLLLYLGLEPIDIYLYRRPGVEVHRNHQFGFDPANRDRCRARTHGVTVTNRYQQAIDIPELADRPEVPDKTGIPDMVDRLSAFKDISGRHATGCTVRECGSVVGGHLRDAGVTNGDRASCVHAIGLATLRGEMVGHFEGRYHYRIIVLGDIHDILNMIEVGVGHCDDIALYASRVDLRGRVTGDEWIHQDPVIPFKQESGMTEPGYVHGIDQNRRVNRIYHT